MRKVVLFFLLSILSSCICNLDEITDLQTLEVEVQSGHALHRVQTVPQFKHRTKYGQRFKEIYCTNSEIMETYLFGPGLLYDLGKDRYDWNKLGGWYFNTFQPHGETIMIGFRSNVQKGATEYTFYYHSIENKDDYQTVGSVPGYVDESNILSVAWDDNLNASTYTKCTLQVLDVKRIALKLEDYEGNAIQDTVSFQEVRSNFSRGNLYHGGNVPAQDRIIAVKAIY